MRKKWPRKGATHGRIGRKSKTMFEQQKPFPDPSTREGKSTASCVNGPIATARRVIIAPNDPTSLLKNKLAPMPADSRV